MTTPQAIRALERACERLARCPGEHKTPVDLMGAFLAQAKQEVPDET